MHNLSSHIRRWIVPSLVTMGFLLLLMHRSEFPVVFNRYSVDYTILLILATGNLALLWVAWGARISYRDLIRRFSSRFLISVVILILCVAFLIDFAMGLPNTPSHWVTLGLLLGILIQAEGLRKESGQLSGQLALFTSSLVLVVILLELLFVRVLAETRTPKNDREFRRLMSFQWPEPIPIMKREGTFRILGLSDSFGTAGGSFNYHYLLQDMLRQAGAIRIELINASVPAHEPKHQLAILRFALAYVPDLVLHGFFVGNDFSLSGDEKYTVREIPVDRREGAFPYRPRNFLLRGWIHNVIGVYAERRRRSAELHDGVVKDLGSFSQEKFLEIQFARMSEWGSRSDKNIERMKSVFPVLDAIRTRVENNGARYVMVIHADQTQVDTALQRQIITAHNVDESAYDFDLPQRVLNSYCLEREILCLDLLPIYRQKAEEEELYLLRDTHYNERGNRLAAATISRYLIQQSLLPVTGASDFHEMHSERWVASAVGE